GRSRLLDQDTCEYNLDDRELNIAPKTQNEYIRKLTMAMHMKNRVRIHSKGLLVVLVFSLFAANALWAFSSTNVRGDYGTPRTVVLELFTATWCATCPYAAEAADTLSLDYGPERFSVLQYHISYPLDLLANDASTLRGFEYDTNDTGLSAAWFDGVEDITKQGEFNTDFFYDKYQDKIDTRLESLSPISVSVSMSESSGNVTVSASFEKSRNIIASDPIYARYVLYENSLEHDFNVHNYVVRDLEEKSFDFNGLPYNENVVFQLQPSWDSSNIGVVVFVQVQDTGEVLQSANAILGSKPTVTMTTDIDGKEISSVTTIQGTASQDTMIVSVRIDGELYLMADGTTNWQFDINPSSLSGGSHTLSIRAYSDNLAYSNLVEADFEAAGNSMMYLIIIVIIIVVAIIIGLVFTRRKRTDQEE
ncbi:MAG: hypothetical protein KAW09_03975, partial [Thermoplasmata archaeon]|nr:hypothetical protein [Thermoplasmata archaeon]